MHTATGPHLMELRHHATRTGAGGRVFCSANNTIQARPAVKPKLTRAVRSIWRRGFETNQADAVRDGSRPAVFVVSLPQRRPGRSRGLFVSPRLEPHMARIGSACACAERGSTTTASWPQRPSRSAAGSRHTWVSGLLNYAYAQVTH